MREREYSFEGEGGELLGGLSRDFFSGRLVAYLSLPSGSKALS